MGMSSWRWWYADVDVVVVVRWYGDVVVVVVVCWYVVLYRYPSL